MDSSDLPPKRGIKATFLLADSAQAAEGKLYVLGGGWNVISAETGPFALAGIIEVPETMTNQQHELRFELIDLDGKPVTVQTPDGERPCVFEVQFSVEQHAGMRPGSMAPIPFAIPHPPLQLTPGTDYEWRFEINARTRDDWRLPFSTRGTDQ